MLVRSAAALLTLVGLSLPASRAATAPPGSGTIALFALLANGQVVRASERRVVRRVQISRRHIRQASGRYLALVDGGRTLLALVPTADPARSELVRLRADDLRVVSRVQLPVDAATPRSLTVASSRAIVVGDRASAGGGRVPVGWVIALPSGRVAFSWSVEKAPSLNWTVFDVAAQTAGSGLYVSYHGGCDVTPTCTGGADAVTIGTGTLLCGTGAQASVCNPLIHGEVAAIEGGVLGTSGDAGVLVRADREVHTVKQWPTRLPGNHQVRLAFDRMRGQAFLLGSCLYRGGLVRIDLRAGWRWRSGFAPGRSHLCGERISAAGGVVAFTNGPEFAGGSGSSLKLVAGESGRLLSRVTLPAAALDVLVRPSPA